MKVSTLLRPASQAHASRFLKHLRIPATDDSRFLRPMFMSMTNPEHLRTLEMVNEFLCSMLGSASSKFDSELLMGLVCARAGYIVNDSDSRSRITSLLQSPDRAVQHLERYLPSVEEDLLDALFIKGRRFLRDSDVRNEILRTLTSVRSLFETIPSLYCSRELEMCIDRIAPNESASTIIGISTLVVFNLPWVRTDEVRGPRHPQGGGGSSGGRDGGADGG